MFFSFFLSDIDPNAFKSLILSTVEDHFGTAVRVGGGDPVVRQRTKEDLYAKVLW